MIGHLYRYPHPNDLTKFIYVGQGLKRDRSHRIGQGSFGRRFRDKFPGVELPQPVREIVEVENRLELNGLETIHMFQYRTWHGYEGGMNYSLPGSIDYGNFSTAHRESLRARMKKQRKDPIFEAKLKASYNEPSVRANRSKITKKRFLDNPAYKAKWIAAIRAGAEKPESKKAVIDALRRRNAIMNHTPEHSERGKVAMSKLREKPEFLKWVESHAPKLTHIRWHENRGITKPSCRFCIPRKHEDYHKSSPRHGDNAVGL
jgi:hypothetical protein